MIVGNGFDIAHGLKTKYSDFREYVLLGNNAIKKLFYPVVSFGSEKRIPYSAIIRKIFDNKCGCEWNDFESYLGRLDYRLLPHIKKIIPCFRIWNNKKEYELRRKRLLRDDFYNFHFLVDFVLPTVFNDWVNHIDVTLSNSNHVIDNIIRNTDYVFTFNYTDVLEKWYSFPNDRIIHLHGKVGEKIIFGHGRSDEELLYGRRGIEFEFRSKISTLRKPVESIINNYNSFFKHCEEIKKIYCCGFSFSDVDLPYIKEICKYLGNDVVWYQDQFNGDGKIKRKIAAIKNCGFGGKIEKFKFF